MELMLPVSGGPLTVSGSLIPVPAAQPAATDPKVLNTLFKKMRAEGVHDFFSCHTERITAILGESPPFWENQCHSGRIFLPFVSSKRR